MTGGILLGSASTDKKTAMYPNEAAFKHAALLEQLDRQALSFDARHALSGAVTPPETRLDKNLVFFSGEGWKPMKNELRQPPKQVRLASTDSVDKLDSEIVDEGLKLPPLKDRPPTRRGPSSPENRWADSRGAQSDNSVSAKSNSEPHRVPSPSIAAFRAQHRQQTIVRSVETMQDRSHGRITIWSKSNAPFKFYAEQLVFSQTFEGFSMAMIFINAIMVGAQVDYVTRNKAQHLPVGFRAVEILFALFFLVEVCVRWTALGYRFFRDIGWPWNVFDLVLVVLQIIEELLTAISSTTGTQSNFVLRLARVLRTTRVFRVLRVARLTVELRLIVSCILHVFRSFLWSFVLLLLMIYVVAVFFTQSIHIARVEGSFDEAGGAGLLANFNSVPQAMLSLFAGLTGGLDWSQELCTPLVKFVSPWHGVLFVLYVAFAMLAVMNVITAIFVQNAMVRAEEIKEINKINQAHRVFRTLDNDRSGTISMKGITKYLERPVVQEWFRAVDIHESQVMTLFDILDVDNSGTIDFHEFLSGCLRLQGPVKLFDHMVMHREIEDALMYLHDMAAHFDNDNINKAAQQAGDNELPQAHRDSEESYDLGRHITVRPNSIE